MAEKLTPIEKDMCKRLSAVRGALTPYRPRAEREAMFAEALAGLVIGGVEWLGAEAVVGMVSRAAQAEAD